VLLPSCNKHLGGLRFRLRIFCLGRHHIETEAGPIEVFDFSRFASEKLGVTGR
jgi:hypothetical protein